MRALCRFAVSIAFFVAACGDNGAVTPDAPPDEGGGGPQCSDDLDNDGDGKIDFPDDPGCSAPNQDDEVDDCPSGASCPQCGNGIDDDGNGQTDFPSDPGCDSASDPTEVVNDPVACGGTLMIKNLPLNGMDSGMLDANSTSQLTNTCNTNVGVPAIAYRINVPMPTVLIASTASSVIDTVLDLRSADCDDAAASLQCSDNVSSSNNTSFLQRSIPAGNYFLVVSGKTATALGAYTLTVERFFGEGATCTASAQCGPGLVCRTPLGGPGMVCTLPQCGDTLDDDNDGKNGFPSDPGCANAQDNDETDDCPNGPTCPVCSNGDDDDGDGMADYPTDPGCSSAGAQSEACDDETDPIGVITMAQTQGTLVGATHSHEPIAGCTIGSMGVDVLYTLALPRMRSLQIDTENSQADTVLSLLNSTCDEPSLACDDDGGTSASSSRLNLTNVNAGNYIVAVDVYDDGASPGTFNLNVSGVIAPGGACDPELTLDGAIACPATSPCEGTAGSMICRPTACVDGMDNDSDGNTDWPDDPGCESVDDQDESDTCPGVGPGCPECADGADNDGDGQTDFPMDTSCTTPGGTSEGCQSMDATIPLILPMTPGNTTGAADDYAASCTSSSHAAPDQIYSIQLPAMRQITIDAGTSFDGVAVLLDSTCAIENELACGDIPETIEATQLAAGNYFLIVDGWGSGEGAYNIQVTGTIRNGASCEVPLAMSGAITCGAGFSCKGATGSRTCRPAACFDGIDNDGDGLADFPNDAGCSDTSDDDESDACPGGVDCPVCADGVDNDGDLLVDYPNDPECPSSSGTSESCVSSDGIVPLVLAVTPGSTDNAQDDNRPSCGSSSHSAGDRLYSLSVPGLETITFDVEADFDGALVLFDSTCAAPELQCEDPEVLTAGPLAGGTYFFSVDGWGSGEGDYTINLSGTIALGESCEGALALSGALTCGAGRTCTGTMGSRTCEIALCADGMDNDSDGTTDYPFDPGCESSSDNDEMDPATPPVCSNNMDDDSDTFMDFPADFGCASAASTSEVFCMGETDMPAVITTTPTTGMTTGATDDFSAQSCAFLDDSTGADVALSLQLPVPVETLTIDASLSDYDTQLSFRPAGCATEIACDEDGGTSLTSLISVSNVDAGNYAIIVDGYGGEAGMFSLDISGVVAPGTACSSMLFTNGVLECPTGTTCTGTPATCQ